MHLGEELIVLQSTGVPEMLPHPVQSLECSSEFIAGRQAPIAAAKGLMSVSATRIARPSKTVLYVTSIMLSATVLGFFNLTRDNGWGDDFAGYILQAQSIVRGNMGELVTKNVQAVERSSGDLRPGNYPWGFPLMLAPVYGVFGVKIIGFKMVLTLCHGLLVVAIFCLARTRLNALDFLIVAAMVAYNAVLISEGQGEVLSGHSVHAALHGCIVADAASGVTAVRARDCHRSGHPHGPGNLRGSLHSPERIPAVTAAGSSTPAAGCSRKMRPAAGRPRWRFWRRP